MSKYMNPTQFRLLEEEAENLIIEYGANFDSLNTPPIPVEMIAERLLNLHCMVSDFLSDDVLGVLLAERKQILINQKCSKNQYIFTIAHEIGHWCLHVTHKPGEKFVDTSQTITSLLRSTKKGGSKKSNQQEIEANRFSASLLIPRALLKSAVASYEEINAVKIYTLAKVFQTSALTMLYRMYYLRDNLELLELHLDRLSLETLEAEERRSYRLYG